MIKMCVRFYPKYDVELTWSSLRSGFAYDPDARICIRLRRSSTSPPEENARSRVMNVQICPECGIDEALRDARDDVLPMSEWYIVKNHYFGEIYDPDAAVLMPNCRFSCLFCARQKRLPPDNADYPVAFVASSRFVLMASSGEQRGLRMKRSVMKRSCWMKLTAFQNSAVPASGISDAYAI